MKAVSRRRVSNRHGASLSKYMPPAASSASEQLVTNSAKTTGRNHPVPSSRYKCAGSAATRTSHHRRGDVRTSSDVRTALGGQTTDVVAGGKRSANPTNEAQ